MMNSVAGIQDEIQLSYCVKSKINYYTLKSMILSKILALSLRETKLLIFRHFMI